MPGDAWIQFDFDSERYVIALPFAPPTALTRSGRRLLTCPCASLQVDMLHLWGYNAEKLSVDGRAPSARFISSLEVQIPDEEDGWRRVGVLNELPPPSLDDHDAGVHIRPVRARVNLSPQAAGAGLLLSWLRARIC